MHDTRCSLLDNWSVLSSENSLRQSYLEYICLLNTDQEVTGPSLIPAPFQLRFQTCPGRNVYSSGETHSQLLRSGSTLSLQDLPVCGLSLSQLS